MYIQNEPGIYVYFCYHSFLNDRNFDCYYFENIEGVCRFFYEHQIKTCFTDYSGIHKHIEYCREYAWSNYLYAAYDHEGNWISPDRLIGIKRKINVYKSKKQYYNRSHKCWKATKYKYNKYLKEIQIDPDIEELDVNVKRRSRIPGVFGWCWEWDYHSYTNNSKSWKDQSKRKRQFK